MVMKTLFFTKILFYDSHSCLVKQINILKNKVNIKQINFKYHPLFYLKKKISLYFLISSYFFKKNNYLSFKEIVVIYLYFFPFIFYINNFIFVMYIYK
jgi:hypothetical protein